MLVLPAWETKLEVHTNCGRRKPPPAVVLFMLHRCCGLWILLVLLCALRSLGGPFCLTLTFPSLGGNGHLAQREYVSTPGKLSPYFQAIREEAKKLRIELSMEEWDEVAAWLRDRHAISGKNQWNENENENEWTLTFVGMKLCMLHHNFALILHIRDLPMLQHTL